MSDIFGLPWTAEVVIRDAMGNILFTPYPPVIISPGQKLSFEVDLTFEVSGE
jgi:hypothetical protein